MAEPTKALSEPVQRVRTRRAYFDCRFGQLHVRTAFPTTGGFDEGTTLLCLHPAKASSRIFDKFLPEIADDRSVYAPDLPGCGESDAAPNSAFTYAASAVADLAADLRLRQIDVLGFCFGAGVALALAASNPELVRRLVLLAPPPMDPLPVTKQKSLVMRLGQSDLAECPDDVFDAAPKILAKQIGDFLRSK